MAAHYSAVWQHAPPKQLEFYLITTKRIVYNPGSPKEITCDIKTKYMDITCMYITKLTIS